jgi:hypothetical protein
MSENKRAGREEELRKKIKEVIERYESVFGSPLTTEALKDFLDYSEAQNRNTFLVDRVGVLSDMDVKYLRNVLKENKKGTRIKDPLPDVDALSDLDDVEDELADLSA